MKFAAKVVHTYRVVQSERREKHKGRSPLWDNIRDAFLKKHPSCAACGSTVKLQVHHKQPYHLQPQLELDEENLIVLCMGPLECHLGIGHGFSWVARNPHVEMDAKIVRLYPDRRAIIEAKARDGRKYI
jgi:hypothetical protein